MTPVILAMLKILISFDWLKFNSVSQNFYRMGLIVDWIFILSANVL